MSLADRQNAFAAHLRDPARVPAPAGIEDRRLGVYRELFFNNISNLLGGTFPVLRRILGREAWARLVRGFYAHHRCATPRFLEVPREFLEYLRDERTAAPDDPPFLLELAHYEWIELAQRIDPDEIDLAGIDRDGDLIDGVPVLNPLAIPLAYRFPVHRLSPDFAPEAAPEHPSFYVVWRDLADRVQFLELNAVSARLIELIEIQPGACGRELAFELMPEALDAPGRFLEQARNALEDLKAREIVLGTRMPAAELGR
jgi:hypothetical protein